MGNKRLPPADRGADASIKHGTDYAYGKQGCRCGICVSTYRAARNAKRRAKSGTPPELIPHGMTGYTDYMCRCEVCFKAGQEWRAPRKDAIVKAGKRRNAESRDLATRHGQQWTGPEMEIAGRDDLTDRQVGLIIGRTVTAVQNMRHLIRHDPKRQRVLGAQD